MTFQRNFLYRDTRALYEQTVACAPTHFKSWGVLSENQLGRGQFKAAQDSSRRAIELNPYYPGGLRILEISSERLGDTAQARDARRLRDELFPSEPLP